jgi:hypothetical protein
MTKTLLALAAAAALLLAVAGVAGAERPRQRSQGGQLW